MVRHSVAVDMSVIMVAPIKLFHSVQISYRSMGIYSPHPNQIFTLNSKKFFFLSSLLISFISRIGYFVFETKFVEYNGFKSFYQTISTLIALSDFSLSIWQMPAILQIIKMFDEFIEKSK